MNRPNRRISNRYLRHILQAIEEEMGGHSLRRMLRSAGLKRYLGEFPPLNNQTEAFASEISALGQVIRAYYGQGARGSLNRIGHAVWRRIAAEAPWSLKVRLFTLRVLPETNRCMKVLQVIVDEMRYPDGQISLHLADTDIIYVDRSSDFTYGQSSEENICWATGGMIQEALSWAMGLEYDIDEIACRATGAETCQFKIPLTSLR